jgi:hypothetical protein
MRVLVILAGPGFRGAVNRVGEPPDWILAGQAFVDGNLRGLAPGPHDGRAAGHRGNRAVAR